MVQYAVRSVGRRMGEEGGGREGCAGLRANLLCGTKMSPFQSHSAYHILLNLLARHRLPVYVVYQLCVVNCIELDVVERALCTRWPPASTRSRCCSARPRDRPP